MKNKSKMIIYLLAGFLIIALTACSQADGGGSDYDATQPSGKQASLENSNWRLVSFGEEGSEAPVQEGTEITLIFDTGGEVGGSGGCNMYSGLYEIFDSNISFNQIVQTEMACTTEGVT
ncbi:MAG: META domain-containing protein, partial [Aliifodinibius sp.]|nr:META domain-containing protein [candidate division Zixibacteria bacterium]NIT55155.1 META domain-containing protein [Fodinibius sp.]NIW43521.1 META domain-containing protein [Gammaproteobacteria bacterium]NIR62528.1 META domain-containing protein [candidate division Zixibacteria bacterium]NIS44671.1 META domain-containing protein [candidate division Zixibacteria bacterium]